MDSATYNNFAPNFSQNVIKLDRRYLKPPRTPPVSRRSTGSKYSYRGYNDNFMNYLTCPRVIPEFCKHNQEPIMKPGKKTMNLNSSGPNNDYINNITCPVRKAFYMQQCMAPLHKAQKRNALRRESPEFSNFKDRSPIICKTMSMSPTQRSRKSSPAKSHRVHKVSPSQRSRKSTPVKSPIAKNTASFLKTGKYSPAKSPIAQKIMSPSLMPGKLSPIKSSIHQKPTSPKLAKPSSSKIKPGSPKRSDSPRKFVSAVVAPKVESLLMDQLQRELKTANNFTNPIIVLNMKRDDKRAWKTISKPKKNTKKTRQSFESLAYSEILHLDIKPSAPARDLSPTPYRRWSPYSSPYKETLLTDKANPKDINKQNLR